MRTIIMGVCGARPARARSDSPDETCLHCGQQLRPFRYREFPHLNEGGQRKLGDYGDNAFCGLRCAYAFAINCAKHGMRYPAK